MKKRERSSPEIELLRSRAEERLRDTENSREHVAMPAHVQRLVHELQVHQVELEMQNEELARSRNELEAMLERYADLYDFAPVGYITLGRDGAIKSINLAGAELLGIDRSHLIGRQMIFFVPYGLRADFADFLGQVFSGDTRKTREIELLNEETGPLVVRIEAVASQAGDECRLAAINISELKQLEDELQKTVETLRREIEERKNVEQQLLQAQKLESIGLLAGGIAHEFNNLLTAISGYGEEIRERIPLSDTNGLEFIDLLQRSALRARELTRNLLAFSRKQDIDLKPIKLNEIIKNTGDFIRPLIGEDIEIRVQPASETLCVLADSVQIQQVLVNLATNARDAMPDGGCLSITTYRVVVDKGSESRYDLPIPGDYAAIAVSDTGSGIAAESMARLFEPFYTTKDVGKGTGLGLSIAYGIVRQHNGSIQVSSTPGSSTTFTIYIPISKCQADVEKTEKHDPLVGGTETLLVAEDEAIIRSFLERTLQRAGYTVILAADGQEAAERFKEHDEISLVLSDVVMPVKKGQELFDEIQKMRPGTRVIFISGYSGDIIEKKYGSKGNVDFLMKPFSKQTLLQKIREALDRS